MAQIQSPETYVDGQQVTATRLNNQTNGAILLPGAITDQTALPANTVAAGDQVILHDISTTTLSKATAGDLLNSGLPVTTSTITGVAGVDVVINPAAGQKVDINANLEVGTITSTGTDFIKIATGTTAQRPASPVAGQLRFNTSTNTLELYSGTLWINGVTSGSALFDGTVNITGALQINGVVGYVLTEVYEETIPYTLSAASQNNLWSSASFTKPVGEIWVFEFSMQHSGYRGYVYEFGIRYGSQPDTTGNFLFIERFHDGNGGGAYCSNNFNGRFVVQSATAITDTLKLDIFQGNAFSIGATVDSTSFASASMDPSKLRIYKYKTA